jgi:uncharacterized membrane protein
MQVIGAFMLVRKRRSADNDEHRWPTHFCVFIRQLSNVIFAAHVQVAAVIAAVLAVVIPNQLKKQYAGEYSP